MANPDKDTIYVDIDDEITGIIDKVKVSSAKVVALVLPKRASVFQSIVNMKLLKRAADSSKKNLVLITSEAGLLPLAGSAGIHVAKTLTSKPEIPLGPQPFEDNDEAVDEDAPLVANGSEPIDSSKSVGQLSEGALAAAPIATKDGVETLMLDNEEAPAQDGADNASVAGLGVVAASDKASKAPKNKKLKVPNFERFRLWLVLGIIILILLIIGFLLLNSSLDKAVINIKTDATNVSTNLNLNLSTNASSLDPSTNTIPAKYDQQQKTFSQQVGTTGQKNEGNKATGTITVSGGSCSPTPPSDVPAGTGVSSNSLTYITQDDITFQPALSHGQCVYEGTDSNNGNSSIPITAQSGGTSYNTSGTPFAISGRSELTASGSASGGTDNMVQVVNQNDINNAKSKISAGNDSAVKSALSSQLDGEGYYPITATYNAGTPSITSSSNVGDQATNVIVTETITYSMYGVHQSDLKTLVDNSVNTQIDTSKQSILDEGLSSAIFNVNSLSASGGQVTMSTKAIAGPHLSISDIKQSSKGKKAGDIKSQLLTNPDVTNVSVSFSPFWVSSAPSNTSKITVNIAKPTSTK